MQRGLHNLLVENQEEHIKFIVKKCDKSEKDLHEGVDTLKEWLKTQPHLPEVPSDRMLHSFLIINKFSIENTKTNIDMYYTIWTLLPELYENKHPLLPHMQWIANNVYIAPSPKLTEEGYRVTCIKLIDNNPQKFEPYDFFAHCFNILEVVLEEDLILAGIVVYDFKHMTTEHMLKITPICLKKVLLITEKVYRNKVKGIHYVNAPPFINRLVSIVKQLLKPKMAARLFVHDSMDKLFDYIPKEVLPEDYGGDEMSLRKLNELWKQKLIEYKDRFDALEQMKVKEELRPTPLVNDEVLGFHGNFKKLAVD